jgi:uncharacterized membrane protein
MDGFKLMWKRIGNKVTLVVLATNIITILQLAGVFEILGLDTGTVTDIAMLVINTVVTLYGLGNNPTDKNAY